MKIAFVLPNATNRAMGGYKVVYQYANYMAERGHAVAILYDDTRMVKGHGPLLEPALRLRARYYLRTEPRWFALHPSIRKKNIFVMERAELEPYDLVVATAKITADDLRRAGIAPGKVLYLIQDFENWGCSAEEVYRSYRYGYRNMAISRQLLQIVEEASGQKAEYLPDGIDTDCFRVTVPVEQRPRHSIAMMYRDSWRKGYPDGLAVLKRLKEQYPDLECCLFGVDPRPADLPGWARFVYRADQQTLAGIYNGARVYLSPSLQEGYGLTGLESMACGCALVSTDTLGVHEYAEDGVTASIVPVGDVEAMAQKASELFEQEDRLLARSREGCRRAQQLSLRAMGARFETIAHRQLEEAANGDQN